MLLNSFIGFQQLGNFRRN